MFDIKDFRKKHALTQQQLADIIGVTSVSVIKVEKGRMKLPEKWIEILKSKFVGALELLAEESDLNIATEQVIKYQKSEANMVPHADFMEAQYLPITAQAGYLDSIESQVDPEIGTILVPKEFEKGHYLVIEIQGDSMNDGTIRAIRDGDKLLVKELNKNHWKNKLHFKTNLFVIMSPEGVVCKQVIDHNVVDGVITCHSWNTHYTDYTIDLKSVFKIFYVKKIVDRKIIF